MRILTETPFTFAAVPGRIAFPAHSLTLVVKGTFDLHPGAPATTADDQLFPTGDEHLPEDEDRTGPIRYASDFAPLKPATDLLLIGACHPRSGKPEAECKVAFQVGEQRHALPVTSELVHGELVTSELVSDRPEATGFGPLAPFSAERQSKLGTYGADYLDRRWPWFPEDFDWHYFNAAPRALQKDGYLRGDEPLVLENLHPDHPRYASSLPGLRVRCFVTRSGEGEEERFDEVEMRLDTLWVDADAERLVLLWRGWTAVADEDFEELGAVFISAEAAADPPQPVAHHRARFAARLAEEAARRSGGTRAEQPAEGMATATGESGAATRSPSPARESATASERGSVRNTAAPRPADPQDRELGELFESVMARVQAATGLDLSTFDPTDPEAASAKVKDYLRGQGVDPDRPPELTPEQRQAQAGLFEGLGIPWDAVAGQPDLDRLQDVDSEALLRRTLEKLDADLAARGLPAREPPPLKPEDVERLRAIGIDAEAFLASLKSQEPPTAGETGEKPLDRDTVQERAASGKSLAGADLSGLDLSGLDLAGADLSGANLTGAKLARAVLSGADLTRARLMGADLAGSHLAGVKLTETDLSGADLCGTDATGADLTGAVAEGCMLREALLHRAVATGAYLVGADLSGAHARGLNLDGANLRGARLDGADLRRASLRVARLQGASAVGVRLDHADLTGLRASEGARLADASLREVSGPDSLWMDSDLTAADLSYARLPGADFTRAVLEGAELYAADLRQAQLRKARLQDAGMSEMNLFRANLERADLSGADLSRSNLYGAELLNARTEGTETEGANLRRTKLEGRAG